MGMMTAGMSEAAARPKMAGMDDQDGDVDQLISCPNCGTQFSPGDTNGDAAQLAGAAPGAPALPNAAAPPEVAPQASTGATCPECGGKMDGGQCASCGYSSSHSPMREAATRHIQGQPEHARPDAEKVYKQGLRARGRMRRPAPFGQGS